MNKAFLTKLTAIIVLTGSVQVSLAAAESTSKEIEQAAKYLDGVGQSLNQQNQTFLGGNPNSPKYQGYGPLQEMKQPNFSQTPPSANAGNIPEPTIQAKPSSPTKRSAPIIRRQTPPAISQTPAIQQPTIRPNPGISGLDSNDNNSSDEDRDFNLQY